MKNKISIMSNMVEIHIEEKLAYSLSTDTISKLSIEKIEVLFKQLNSRPYTIKVSKIKNLVDMLIADCLVQWVIEIQKKKDIHTSVKIIFCHGLYGANHEEKDKECLQD